MRATKTGALRYYRVCPLLRLSCYISESLWSTCFGSRHISRGDPPIAIRHPDKQWSHENHDEPQSMTGRRYTTTNVFLCVSVANYARLHTWKFFPLQLTHPP